MLRLFATATLVLAFGAPYAYALPVGQSRSARSSTSGTAPYEFLINPYITFTGSDQLTSTEVASWASGCGATESDYGDTDGDMYTVIEDHGFFRWAADMLKWTKYDNEPEFKNHTDGMQWFRYDGNNYIALAQSNKDDPTTDGIVVIVKEVDVDDYEVDGILERPQGTEFDTGSSYGACNDYFDASAGKFHPSDVAANGGDLYIMNSFHESGTTSVEHCLMKAHHDGTKWAWDTLAWGANGAGNGDFDQPRGVSFYDDRVFVADQDNNRVQLFDTSGNYKGTLAGIPSTAKVTDITRFEGSDDLVVAAQSDNKIYVWSGNTATGSGSVVSTIKESGLGITGSPKHTVHPHVYEENNYFSLHGMNPEVLSTESLPPWPTLPPTPA